jgi:chromosome segregation ATPase
VTEPTSDSRLYQLGQSLGRLEGQVEALVQSLQREHDERIAAMKEQERRSDATDRRIEEILSRLADQISGVASNNSSQAKEIQDLKDRRGDSVSASRWFVGIGLTIVVATSSWYGSFRGVEQVCPSGFRPPELNR